MSKPKRLHRIMSYYGAKWAIAKKYPEPKHDLIVEPFAGSAGYALHYYERDVIIVEKNEKAASVWQYVIDADPDEIMSLPLLEPGQDVRDLGLPDAQTWLIGWWLNNATVSPTRTLSKWGRINKSASFWTERRREMIAETCAHIKHWQLIHGDYTDAPDVKATWFVDPPYQDKGRHYPCGSKDIDFLSLSDWCKSREGQVIVCENTSADWLPFEHLCDMAGSQRHASKKSSEAIWTNEILQ